MRSDFLKKRKCIAKKTVRARMRSCTVQPLVPLILVTAPAAQAERVLQPAIPVVQACFKKLFYAIK